MTANSTVGFAIFDKKVPTFKYGGANDYTIIGEGSAQFTYDSATQQFKASSNGTRLQFYRSVQTSGEQIITPEPSPILVHDIPTNTSVPLTTIHRNQHIQLNIIFR